MASIKKEERFEFLEVLFGFLLIANGSRSMWPKWSGRRRHKHVGMGF